MRRSHNIHRWKHTSVIVTKDDFSAKTNLDCEDCGESWHINDIDSAIAEADMTTAINNSIDAHLGRCSRLPLLDTEEKLISAKEELDMLKKNFEIWKKPMECGHPDFCIEADDPPYCTACKAIQDVRAEAFEEAAQTAIELPLCSCALVGNPSRNNKYMYLHGWHCPVQIGKAIELHLRQKAMEARSKTNLT